MKVIYRNEDGFEMECSKWGWAFSRLSDHTDEVAADDTLPASVKWLAYAATEILFCLARLAVRVHKLRTTSADELPHILVCDPV